MDVGFHFAASLRIGGYEVFDHSYDAVVIGAGGAGGVNEHKIEASKRSHRRHCKKKHRMFLRNCESKIHSRERT